jgi:hypothetical protein
VKFTQIIEFSTGRIDDFNTALDTWMTKTEGSRIPHRAVLRRDRDADDRYLLTVEFDSHDLATKNSSRPETSAFADFLSELSNTPLNFRNLDVLREDDL